MGWRRGETSRSARSTGSVVPYPARGLPRSEWEAENPVSMAGRKDDRGGKRASAEDARHWIVKWFSGRSWSEGFSVRIGRRHLPGAGVLEARLSARGEERYAQTVGASRKDPAADRMPVVGVYLHDRAIHEDAQTQRLSEAQGKGSAFHNPASRNTAPEPISSVSAEPPRCARSATETQTSSVLSVFGEACSTDPDSPGRAAIRIRQRITAISSQVVIPMEDSRAGSVSCKSYLQNL